jgi:hypothetical protein
MLKYAIAIVMIGAFMGSAKAEREFSFNKSDNFSGAAVSAIKIDMDNGEISIVKSSDSGIRVDFKNTVYAKNESNANEINNDCKYKAEISGDRLIIKVELPHFRLHDKSILSRVIQGDWSDNPSPLIRVSIPDNKSIQINSASADIEASEVTCDLTVQSASSDISLENTTGNIECNISSGDVDITGHRGHLSINGNSSDLRLADIEGDVDGHSSSGDINVDKVKGAVQLSTSSGDSRIYDIDGNLDISSTSGEIEASGVTGSVRANAISGDVKLTALSATQGDFKVESVSGDVQVEISREYAGQVQARSVSGTVNSHLSGELDKDSDSQVRGSIGNGEGRLNVSTTSGDINIDRF